MPHYDAIVLGTGGVGSAALFHLASRGARVLGLDRFAAGHDRGSSHGHTRIIRQAYFEHPDYVPLLREAYRLWDELEQLAGQQLFFPVGLLEVGPVDGVLVAGVLQSARRHHLAVELLDSGEAQRRWPGFVIPPDYRAVFEARAGYLLVEDCVRTHLEQARRLGAAWQAGDEVLTWQATAGGVQVRTKGNQFTADRLLVTAGAWSAALLGELGVPLRVLRKPLHWYRTADPRYQASQGCPTFFYELPAGYFYGMPACDPRGVKVAQHSGGREVVDPLQVDREVDAAEREEVERFLRGYLPGVSGPASDHAVCLYTMSPDEHFVVDRHPRHPQVVFAAGLSGHGFKFTSVLGCALCQLALDGSTALPIDFLRCDRPALA